MAKNKPNKSGYYRYQKIYSGVKIDLTCKDEKDLAEKVRRRKNEIDSGLDIRSANVTVETWAKKWLEIYKKPAVSDKSYKLYESNINNHILPSIGKMKLSAVKPMDLQDILNALEGKSESHVKHVRLAITSMFKQAHKNNFICTDPSANITLPAVTKGIRRSLTEYEKEIFFKVCESHYARMWALTAYYTGIRPQEAAALLWGDIDIEKRRIRINKAMESGTRNINVTKTHAGVRSIPIAAPLLLLLTNEKSKYDNKTPVFTVSTGRQCCVDSICVWWNSIRRQMDIMMGAKLYRNQIIESKITPGLTAYCLRHTYCTDLQRAGVPLNVAKYLMGHNDVTVTANIYGHHTDDQTEAARQKVDLLYEIDAKKGTKPVSKRYKVKRSNAT